MFLQNFYTPGLSIYSYLIADTATKHAAIIDPTRELEPYLDAAKKEGFTITDILETHVHADFVSGSKELKEKLQGKAKIHCSAMGGEYWTPNYADHKVHDDDSISLGNVRLQAIHTPGHTPEHIIWLCFDENRSKDVACAAFTGDLLFVNSIGRPDLLGQNEVAQLSEQLYDSLFKKIKSLPDFLEIFPAHGAGSLCGKGLSAKRSSTLGYERKFNPFLIETSKDAWLKKVTSEIPVAPVNFSRLKQINRTGPIKQIQDKTSMLWIDVRAPEIYAKKHIDGSINVPLGSGFCNWFGSVVAENVVLGVVGENQGQLADAVKNLHQIGFDQISEQEIWDEKKLAGKHRLDSFPMVSVASLAEIKGKDQNSYILDVRTTQEWKAGHIENAHHHELPNLKNDWKNIPRDAHVYAICGSGLRASVAASFLKKQGFPTVSNVQGGMNAWNKMQQG